MHWLVTFVTHNSRTSDRMFRYGIRPGEPAILRPEDRVLVASAFAETAGTQAIRILAFNVLPDHVHMIIEAESEKVLAVHVQRLKGYSAHVYRKNHLISGSGHVWAEKFNRRLIRDKAALGSMLHYVANNHLKHADQWGASIVSIWEDKIKPIVEATCSPNMAGLSELL